jgi:hypothetical protein
MRLSVSEAVRVRPDHRRAQLGGVRPSVCVRGRPLVLMGIPAEVVGIPIRRLVTQPAGTVTFGDR